MACPVHNPVHNPVHRLCITLLIKATMRVIPQKVESYTQGYAQKLKSYAQSYAQGVFILNSNIFNWLCCFCIKYIKKYAQLVDKFCANLLITSNCLITIRLPISDDCLR